MMKQWFLQKRVSINCVEYKSFVFIIIFFSSAPMKFLRKTGWTSRRTGSNLLGSNTINAFISDVICFPRARFFLQMKKIPRLGALNYFVLPIVNFSLFFFQFSFSKSEKNHTQVRLSCASSTIFTEINLNDFGGFVLKCFEVLFYRTQFT